MVSIGQNLAFRAAQLNSTQKTVQTEENTAENNTVANQAAVNTSEGNAKTIMPSTDLLLANNGIKINKPAEPEQPSIEVNSNFDFDDFNDFTKTVGKGIYKDGDTISIGDRKGTVMTLVDPNKRVSHKEHQYLIVVFEDGSSYRL